MRRWMFSSAFELRRNASIRRLPLPWASLATAEWRAPARPQQLDARVAASYRGALDPPAWRRLWHARISVPVPVVAVLLIALLAASGLEFRPSGRESGGKPSAGSGLAELRPLEEIRIRVTEARKEAQ